MPTLSSRVPPRIWFQALMTQRIAPITMHFQIPSKELEITSRPVAAPKSVTVPTRHGHVRCLIFSPHPAAPLADGRPPVVLQIHGGAFMIRAPRQDDHINRYLAGDVGAVVVSPDYSVAPQAHYPVAEEQVYDVARWIVANGADRGWDVSRLAVAGTSAGGKLAINVVQQARDAGDIKLRAGVFSCSVVDCTRDDKTSPLEKPYITPAMQQVAIGSYFPEVGRRTEPIASPLFDPRIAEDMPPSLIMTGGLDALGPEMDQFAQKLSAAGVDVSHKRYENSDHGFGHSTPIDIAHDSLKLFGAHMLKHLAIREVS